MKQQHNDCFRGLFLFLMPLIFVCSPSGGLLSENPRSEGNGERRRRL